MNYYPFIHTTMRGKREAPQHNQFEDFAAWAPVDTMKPEHLNQTISNTKAKTTLPSSPFPLPPTLIMRVGQGTCGIGGAG